MQFLFPSRFALLASFCLACSAHILLLILFTGNAPWQLTRFKQQTLAPRSQLPQQAIVISVLNEVSQATAMGQRTNQSQVSSQPVALAKQPQETSASSISSITPSLDSESSPQTPQAEPDTRYFEIAKKYRHPDSLDQTARPVADFALTTDFLPARNTFAAVIQVFVNADGVVEEFMVMSTNLSPEQAKLVFQTFRETPFIPGYLRDEPQDSFVTLEFEIDTFPLDMPRTPALSIPAK